MKRNTLLFVALVAMALSFTVNMGFAQADAKTSIYAHGTVLAPLGVSGTDLDFGNNIMPGHVRSVARTAGTAGTFTITGDAGHEITADFGLPTDLVSGGNVLPISFSATDGGYLGTNVQASAVAFDPAGQQTWTLVGGFGYVWIGGTVTPAPNQPAGTYTAEILLSVNYTGN